MHLVGFTIEKSIISCPYVLILFSVLLMMNVYSGMKLIWHSF